MEHHQRARAFLHCSSTAVYKPAGHRVFDEDGPLGDNHGVWPFLRTYSICKIAAEGTARWGAERFGLPTTIARLSVPYGDNGGWPAIHLHMMLSGHAIPVHVDAPSVYHPLHADDILAMVPRLLAAASVPAVTVNWGGSEPVSIEEWCTYLAELAGTEARFEPTEHTIDSVQIDTTRMHELVGPDDGPLARGHARAWPRRCTPTGWREHERPGRGPRSASSVCDPEEPPASELLAAMRAELNDVYETFSRLDNPPLDAGRAAAARRRLPRRATRAPRRWPGEGCAAWATAWRRSSGCTSAPPPARAAWRRRSSRALEDAARSLGYTAVRLDTGPKQVHAQRLYRAAGLRRGAALQRQPVRLLLGGEAARAELRARARRRSRPRPPDRPRARRRSPRRWRGRRRCRRR